MSLPATAKWIGLALLGLAIAAAVAIPASHLTSRQIGLSSESITAGDRLAPAVRPAGTGGASGHGGNTATTPTDTAPTVPPPTTVPTAPTTTAPPPTVPPPATTTAPTGQSDSGDDHGGAAPTGGGGADD